MKYTVPAYTRDQIDAAGNVIATRGLWVNDYDAAVAIANNWRSSHSFPLNTFQVTLRAYARDIEATSLVAQRIKRFESIRIKLTRFNWLKLSQMQDLGGCRAVMSSVSQVDELVERYKNSRIKHKLVTEDDYIRSPKKSGYRGVHLVYSYNSDKSSTYNGQRIEMQIRSNHMHAWATAVETVDTFSRQNLKTGKGELEWRRFFALMSSYFALIEDASLVPKTPSDPKELIDEIRELASKLDVIRKLTAYGEAVTKHVQGAPINAQYYLLILDPATQRTEIWAFEREEIREAQTQMEIVEQTDGKDVVLVSVDSVDALQRAYPNYFLDTELFLNSVIQAVTTGV